jgi:hypothetical protein
MFKPLKKNTLVELLKRFLKYKEYFQTEKELAEAKRLVQSKEVESTAGVSIEIRNAFSKFFASEIAEQKVFMLIDSLSDLALRIQQYAIDNQIDRLKMLALQFKNDIDAFDFELIQNTLSCIEEDFCLKDIENK